MKKVYGIIIAMIMIIPMLVSAEELVGEEVKYYKSYEYGNIGSIYSFGSDNIINTTVEITEEEFNNAPKEENLRGTSVIHTNYKRLTTRLYANGLYYRYEAALLWKQYPAKRSWDIIAIGFYASVRPTGGISFQQEYCNLNGDCYYASTHYPQQFSSGVGTSFKLPTTTGLTLLEQTLSFNVTKTNPNSTIINQVACGDYAHATSNITQATSMDYDVDYGTCIELDNSITGYYDTTPAAIVNWSGTW